MNESELRAARGVKRRQKTGNLDFQVAKKAAYIDLEAWVEAVRRGDIVKRDSDGTD